MSALLILLAGLLSFAISSSAQPAASNSLTWKAGVSTTVITPATNMFMAGYASRNKPSEGKAQDLFAKALAIEDANGSRMVFVTVDLIGIPRIMRKSLEKRLLTAHQLKPEQFILNASHTHCGPEFRVGRTPSDEVEFNPTLQGERYGEDLENKVFALIGDALKQLAPSKIAYTHARCGFAMNRRLPLPNGDYRNAPNPDGPVDHDVPVLRVDGPDGKLRAVLFGYACHNTTLSFYQFCGDYAGFAQEYLQADNPGVTALFMTGCGGDQNPYPRGTIDLAQKHGRSLATSVEAALFATAKPLTGSLKSAYAEIDLTYATPPTREELTARLQSKDKYQVIHAQRMLDRIAKDGALPKTYPYPVQVVQLGNEVKLIALGGEVVVDYSLRFKREFGNRGSAVWVAGYSNDVMGYIPSERILKEGGYEGGGAMLFSPTHPGPWAAGVEEPIANKVNELDRQVRPNR
ncbi:MAG TPA: neutral/alkaline non-lysosomal ceramidase N-terminal domain-containing protein [Verrucomicrobiae bacterium]